MPDLATIMGAAWRSWGGAAVKAAAWRSCGGAAIMGQFRT